MLSLSLFSGFLLFGFLLVACPVASAQGQWSELPPGERWLHAAAFDPVNDDLVVVSGVTNEGEATKVLRFELNGDPYWFEVATMGEPPPPRTGATLVYDPNGSRMILFGGVSESTSLNDVWALDVSTHAWTTSPRPARRPRLATSTARFTIRTTNPWWCSGATTARS